MSRTSLKKELNNLSAPQLVEIILDAYQARPEIKEYFEYFLNPDVNKLIDKHNKIIDKEYNRGKWHNSKARVSVLNKAVKTFESFSPGNEAVIQILLREVIVAGVTENELNFADTHFNRVVKLVDRILSLSEEAGVLADSLTRLNQFVSDDYKFASRYMKRLVKDTVNNYNSNKTLTKK
ncbi:MAG: hypothetical protein K2G40_07110 [Muribaculaceae bacterium]|nr:hypothetical protein [Muribaculaceae bacterium]